MSSYLWCTYVKAALWDQFSFFIPYWSSVFHGSCFYFFQNFHIFTNIFNHHFYETRSNPNKLFVYLKDDWMFSQHWVDNQCCRCVLPCPDYKTPISGECSDHTVWYVGICDVKCWILLTCFVYMAIYDLEIQLFLFRCFKIVFWLFRIFS